MNKKKILEMQKRSRQKKMKNLPGPADPKKAEFDLKKAMFLENMKQIEPQIKAALDNNLEEITVQFRHAEVGSPRYFRFQSKPNLAYERVEIHGNTALYRLTLYSDVARENEPLIFINPKGKFEKNG